MTVKEFLILSSVASNTSEVGESIRSLPYPAFVGGHKVPNNLNDLTIGQLIELQTMTDEKECLFVPCRVLFGMDKEQVLSLQAIDVIGLSLWIAKEVGRISELFASASVPPTSEEKQAGVERLSFGMFGILDYYALRMGITDHEDVERVPWVRVYKCMEMDAAKIQYERRLRIIYQKRNKK